jgi:hypothetical protein
VATTDSRIVEHDGDTTFYIDMYLIRIADEHMQPPRQQREISRTRRGTLHDIA